MNEENPKRCKGSVCSENDAHIYRDEIKSLIEDLNKIASTEDIDFKSIENIED